MPTLPVYTSNQNINTAPAGVERNIAAQPFKDIQNVVGTLQDVTQKLSDAHDVMQETKAKTGVETALAQQEKLAENDPNPDNAEAHLKAVQDIVKNSPKIDNQEVAGKVGLELQQSAFLSGIKIQDLFKKKQMFANDVALDQLATTAAQNKANAVSPSQGQQDEDNFKATIQKNVNTGLISPQRGLDLVKQFNVGVVKTKIAQNPSENPDDYKGLTDGLDIKESSEVQKMIAAHIKENVQANVIHTFNNRVSVLKGIATKQINWQSQDQINKLSKGDAKLGTALQTIFDAKSQGQDYEPTSADNQKYSESVSNLFKSKTKEEISGYLVSALSDKGMTEDKMAILVNAAEKRAENLPINEQREIDSKQIQIDGGMDATQRWNKEHGGNDPQVLDDYIKGVNSGKQPQESYKQAIETKQIKMNPERTKYEVGQVLFNKKNGMSAEVIGFDDNGAPLVRVKHGKPKPDKPTDKQPK